MADLGEESIADFSNNGLKKIKVPPFGGPSKPTTLIYDRNQITKIEGLDKYQNHLQKISLAENRVVRMSGLCRMRQLRMLNLPNNSIVAIEGLRELRQLCWLNLSGNSLKHIGHSLATNAKLSHLDLSDNNLGGGLEGTDFRHMKSLSTLLLHGNLLSTLRFTVGSLPTSIAILSLAENEIHDLTEVSYLYSLAGLEQLSVMNNPAVCGENVRAAPKHSTIAPSFPPSTSDFDYRPYVINWCLNLKILDGAIVTKKESLKAEWLLSQGRGRHFQPMSEQHSQLVSYLRKLWPVSRSELDSNPEETRTNVTEEDLKLMKVLAKQQQYSRQIDSNGCSPGNDFSKDIKNNNNVDDTIDKALSKQDSFVEHYRVETPSLLKKPMGFLPEYDVKSFLPQTESKSDNLPHQDLQILPVLQESLKNSTDACNNVQHESVQHESVQHESVQENTSSSHDKVAKRELNRTNLRLKMLESSSEYLPVLPVVESKVLMDVGPPSVLQDHSHTQSQNPLNVSPSKGTVSYRVEAEVDTPGSVTTGQSGLGSNAPLQTGASTNNELVPKCFPEAVPIPNSSPATPNKYEEYDSRPIRPASASAASATEAGIESLLHPATTPTTGRGGQKVPLSSGGFSYSPQKEGPSPPSEKVRNRHSVAGLLPVSENNSDTFQRSSSADSPKASVRDRSQTYHGEDPSNPILSKYDAYNDRPVKPLSQDIINTLYKPALITSTVNAVGKTVSEEPSTDAAGKSRPGGDTTNLNTSIPLPKSTVDSVKKERPEQLEFDRPTQKQRRSKEAEMAQVEDKDVDESLDAGEVDVGEASVDSELIAIGSHPLTGDLCDLCDDCLDTGAGEFIATEDELEEKDSSIDEKDEMFGSQAAVIIQKAWRKSQNKSQVNQCTLSGVGTSRKDEMNDFLLEQLQRCKEHMQQEQAWRKTQMQLMTTICRQMQTGDHSTGESEKRSERLQDTKLLNETNEQGEKTDHKTEELSKQIQILTNTCMDLKEQVSMLQFALSSICNLQTPTPISSLHPHPHFPSKNS